MRGAFAAVLGEQLAMMCDSIELRGGVLTVRTSNPALAHQLTADASPLLGRLNDMSLGRTITKLQVRTGRPAR